MLPQITVFDKDDKRKCGEKNHHLGGEHGWRENRRCPSKYAKPLVDVHKDWYKNDQNFGNKIPEDWYLIAEIFHVFGSKILLQKQFDCNICPIPYSTENFTKKP